MRHRSEMLNKYLLKTVCTLSEHVIGPDKLLFAAAFLPDLQPCTPRKPAFLGLVRWSFLGMIQQSISTIMIHEPCTSHCRIAAEGQVVEGPCRSARVAVPELLEGELVVS